MMCCAPGLVASIELMQEHVPDRAEDIANVMGLLAGSSVAAGLLTLMKELGFANIGYTTRIHPRRPANARLPSLNQPLRSAVP